MLNNQQAVCITLILAVEILTKFHRATTSKRWKFDHTKRYSGNREFVWNDLRWWNTFLFYSQINRYLRIDFLTKMVNIYSDCYSVCLFVHLDMNIKIVVVYFIL